MADAFEKLHLSVKFNNIYRRIRKVNHCKPTIAKLQKPILSKPLPDVARKQCTKEECSAQIFARKYQYLDCFTDEEDNKYEGISSQNVPEIKRNYNRCLSSNVMHACRAKKDDIDLISSSEEDGETSPVQHSSERDLPIKSCNYNVTSEKSNIDKENNQRLNQSQEIVDSNPTQRRYKMKTKRAVSPSNRRRHKAKSKKHRGESFGKTTSQHVESKHSVTSPSSSTIENKRSDIDVNLGIHFIRGESKSKGKSTVGSNYLHWNIMPLSDALHRVNAPAATNHQSLFGLGGIENNRNMNWQTIIDEG